MKVIDLLNKIANGEELPKKIKWGEFELEWEELGYHDYKFLETGNHLLFQGFATSVLNDEVEIIKEDKGIENNFQHVYNSDNDLIDANFENIKTTLENIIKAINEMREDK